MSIKKIFIALVVFTCMFANSISQNTSAMKRNRECIEVANTVVEVPQKRVCTRSMSDDDLALAKKKFEYLSKSEIKESLLSGYEELNFRYEMFLLTSKLAGFEMSLSSRSQHFHACH